MQNAVHFVGFKKDAMRWNAAVKVFGMPDIIHYRWDVRAQSEIAPGDIVVFAEGNEYNTPSVHAYDDSSMQ